METNPGFPGLRFMQVADSRRDGDTSRALKNSRGFF